MHMCFMGARVNVLIEFPNVGSTPTICVQEGGKTEAANGFIARLAPGSCRNGRSLDPLSMLCMKDDGEGRSLACKDRAGRDGSPLSETADGMALFANAAEYFGIAKKEAA